MPTREGRKPQGAAGEMVTGTVAEANNREASETEAVMKVVMEAAWGREQ